MLPRFVVIVQQIINSAFVWRVFDVGYNPVGVVIFFRRFPRVARASQPWALGHSPVGAELSGRFDKMTRLNFSLAKASDGSSDFRRSEPNLFVRLNASTSYRDSRAFADEPNSQFL